VGACLSRFGDVLILKQDRCAVCVERIIGSEIVLVHLMELLGEWIMWNHVLIHLETVLGLV
jgi:hypothetical protein